MASSAALHRNLLIFGRRDVFPKLGGSKAVDVEARGEPGSRLYVAKVSPPLLLSGDRALP